MMNMITLFFIGCEDVPKTIVEPSSEEGDILKDQDGDGYLSDEDCNDDDPSIFPETF